MLQPKLGITLQHELLNGVGNIRSSIGMSWLLKFNQEPDKGSRVDLPNHSNAAGGRRPILLEASAVADLSR
jgi:hypothetical protein